MCEEADSGTLGRVANAHLKRSCIEVMRIKFHNKIKSSRFLILRIVFLVLLLFSLINILFYFIIEKKCFNELDRNLLSLHREIRDLIIFDPKWDISQYFNDTEVYDKLKNTCIFTAEGFCIDMKVEKKNNWLHTFSVKTLNELKEIRSPLTVTSAVNERCRIYAETIHTREGLKGLTLVSISEMLTSLKDLSDIDKKLTESARTINRMISYKDGKLITEDIQSKMIPAMVSYAIIDERGHLKESVGGPPLWIEKASIETYLQKDTISETVEKFSKKYRLISSTYKTRDKSPKLLIITFHPLDELEISLNQLKLFGVVNFSLLSLSAVSLIVLYFRRFISKTRPGDYSVEEALKLGEGQEIEFKKGVPEKSLPAEVCAFANTKNGCIFIGITDDGRIEGLGDLEDLKEKDLILEKIVNVITKSIKPRIKVSISIWEYKNKKGIKIFVPRGPEPIYMTGDSIIYMRYMTQSKKAEPTDIPGILESFYKQQ